MTDSATPLPSEAIGGIIKTLGKMINIRNQDEDSAGLVMDLEDLTVGIQNILYKMTETITQAGHEMERNQKAMQNKMAQTDDEMRHMGQALRHMGRQLESYLETMMKYDGTKLRPSTSRR